MWAGNIIRLSLNCAALIENAVDSPPWWREMEILQERVSHYLEYGLVIMMRALCLIFSVLCLMDVNGLSHDKEHA